MSNYGALAILALTMKRRRKVPSPDEADLRWLITLETFPPDASGWRWAGAHLIADESGLAYSTSRQARDRLVAAGVVEYRQGNGRGRRSSYRFVTPLKVPTLARHIAEAGEGGFAEGADLSSAPFSCVEKVPRQPEKGAEHNPLTCGNANPALEAFAVPPNPQSKALGEPCAKHKKLGRPHARCRACGTAGRPPVPTPAPPSLAELARAGRCEHGEIEGRCALCRQKGRQP